jgi:hypothetical protein
MRRALGALLLTALPLGCASTARVPETPQTATLSPRPSPSALPPAPQVSPRIDNEDQAVREVKAQLTRANEIVAQADPSRLGSEQQEMLSGLKDFISKAGDALRARDVPRAQVLADKASRLAEDLALALKNAKAPR